MTKTLSKSFIKEKGLKNPIQPSIYPTNWRERSSDYRKRHNYTCEFCGVDCSAYPELIDAHHKNSLKEECDDKNLECLCKYHHVELHPHYKSVIKNYQEILKKLEKLWDEQGKTPYKPGIKSHPTSEQ